MTFYTTKFHTKRSIFSFNYVVACAAAGFILASLCAANVVRAEDWGSLKGQFIYDGKAPAETPLNLTQDVAYCGKPPVPVNQEIEVNDKGGMANVVVWLTSKDVKVNPDYEKTAKQPAVLDNSHCRFDPHVLGMRIGQPLEVKNSDPMGHNTKIEMQAAFNQTIPASEKMEVPIAGPENLPVQVSCGIHPWMKAWLVVRPDPYFAVSDKDGKFEIKNLPVGTELTFAVWQEKSGYVQSAQIDGKDAGWKISRNRTDKSKDKNYAFKTTIKPGDNDLGVIKLDPKQFDK